MTTEIPLELTQLRERLHRDFTGKLPEAVTGSTQEERERNFLSRALAAFAVQQLSGCTPDEAAAAVVDGGRDGGIDALHYEPATQRLWVVQSKFMAEGQGEPALGEVAKFKEGLENMLMQQFDAFQQNAALAPRLPQLKLWFEQTSLQVRAALVYSGIHTISDDRRRMFENLRERFSNNDDYFTALPYNLTSVHEWLLGGERAPGVDLTLTLHYPARVEQQAPYEMYYGLVALADLAKLLRDNQLDSKALVAANIRAYKGSTSVNDQIHTTLVHVPEHFLYLNNGLTAYCASVRVVAADRANRERQRLELKGFSIVNGAQTLGSIERCAIAQAEGEPKGFVFLKLISLERCANEREFAREITRCTNFQNRVGWRDFAALDPEQARIANHLELSNIHYHFRDSADAPDPDEENFNFDEALLALACLEGDAACELCARALANRDSLRSDEPVYSTTDPFRSRYQRLFRPDRSALTIWRAVQVKRAVVGLMQASTRAESGRRKQFFENARWLVLHLIFLRLHPERGSELTLASAEQQQLSIAVNELSEALWTVCGNSGESRHFKTVFSTATDCQRLKGATLARLNQPTSPATSL